MANHQSGLLQVGFKYSVLYPHFNKARLHSNSKYLLYF